MAFDELYQEIILDHYRNPRNSAVLDRLSDEHIHENPTCGDSVKIEVSSDGKRVEKVLFEGSGCAMSMASASMMTELLTGLTLDEAKARVDDFISIMQGKETPEKLEEYEDLICFQGVIRYPNRVKCVTLPWHAVRDELDAVSG